MHCTERVFTSHATFAAEVIRNAKLAALPDIWKERFLAKVETMEAESVAAKQAEIDRIKGELGKLKVSVRRGASVSRLRQSGLGADSS